MSNPIASAMDRVAPSRMGRGFRLLLASSVLTNAGDGIALAAGPLLVASQTRDPFLVSLAALAQHLPALLFGVGAGVVADRVDRVRLMAAVNVVRAAILVVLAATIVTDTVSIAIVLGALFALGTAETFADIGGQSVLPRLVGREDLGVANARLAGGVLVTNQLLGPPIGAALFTLGMAIPFVADAAGFALGAVLVSRIAYSQAADPVAGERRHWRDELTEGVRWLVAHPPMRTLAITIVGFNVTFGVAWSVLVLYALERLGMRDIGFGLITTAIAVGGIVGTASYGWLERRFSLAAIMRVGLLIETATHLVLAVTTVPTVALATFVVFGIHEFVWGTTATVVRQRAVPDALLGRVTSVYHVGGRLGLVIGFPIGGLIAQRYGVTAPFWFAFVGSLVLVLVLWRQFANIVDAGGRVAPAQGAAGG